MRLGSITEVQLPPRNNIGFYDRWLNPVRVEADEPAPVKLLKIVILPITLPVFFFTGGYLGKEPWVLSEDDFPNPPM